ncbi:Bromodomain-containing protein [Gilbertella persicaria]|uniref:Bromodomain-containing protein n=1 Tax=Gilbertella persicaria TaxID=101096 RepID=UPI00222009E8|nr:Bromodomain-containing protein [Gilbertella persicaria]KAI8079591.1 Bromodomain-containing protein [Gilbertella persicaria]
MLKSTYPFQSQTLPSPPLQTMTPDQQKYCSAIMRNLKKHRDAAPFLNPVDYVKLNVPDYPTIIKQPMHLLLVDQKLNQSEYTAVEDFISDVRLIFNNCFKYNGPEAMISVLCQNVESAFEKSLRQMPPSHPSSPKIALSPSVSPPPQEHFTKPISEDLNRPKREIHVPSKDYPQTLTHNKRTLSADLKFCSQILREMKRAKYRAISYPFLQPVDPVALNIPDYPTIVKRPMDLSTMERKLTQQEYRTADEFESDMSLMFSNCYLYNPPSLPIYSMAKQFEKVFRDKWEHKPVVEKKKTKAAKTSDVEEDDDRIAELERHIASISEQIASIKSSKKQPRRVKRKRPEPKKEEFTFEQKKELSEMINELTGDKLDTVVSIIQNSMPNLQGDGQQEIELDIDSLDIQTLHRLSEFVNPKAKKKAKRLRTNYSTKRQDQRIKTLQDQLDKFNAYPQEGSSSSSEEDSDEDRSSGSSSSDSD